MTDLAGNQIAADADVDLLHAGAVPVHDLRSQQRRPRSRRRRPRRTTARSRSACKFRSAEDGYITALRFYKQSNNTGTHVGHLWSADGQLLASIPFADETASGWQSVELPNPVAITKDTVYVASYYSPGGYFPFDQSYFTTPHDGGMLTALGNSESANGVYKYGASGFPTESFNATNYWVDATLRPHGAAGHARPGGHRDGAGLLGQRRRPRRRRHGHVRRAARPGLASPARPSRCAAPGGAIVPATVSYDAQTRTAKLDPTAPLAFQSVYTATLEGGSGGVADARRQPADGRQDVDLHDRRPVADRGPGRPDPRR